MEFAPEDSNRELNLHWRMNHPDMVKCEYCPIERWFEDVWYTTHLQDSHNRMKVQIGGYGEEREVKFVWEYPEI